MLTTRVAVLAAPFLLILSGPALADNHEPDLADVWFVEVKDGMDKEFRRAFTEHLKYRIEKDDARAYRTYTPVIGDDLNHYVIRYCCVTYEDMDGYGKWGQDAKAGEHWNENVDKYVASYRHYLQKIDFANSNWPKEEPGFQLYGVTTYKHKMGTNASIEASKSALASAAKENKWSRYWSFMRNIGGNGRVGLVIPFMNNADMKPPEESFSEFLARHHGEEEAGQMLSAWTDNFVSTNYSVYRYVPDLSMDTMKKK